MDFEGALRARLLAAPAVTALVAQKVYWEERPQSTPLPAITLNLVSDERDQHLGGFQTVLDALLQVDVWALSFASKKAIKEAVIAALAPPETSNGIRFQAAVGIAARTQNERTDTQFIYRDAIDIKFHYSPA